MTTHPLGPGQGLALVALAVASLASQDGAEAPLSAVPLEKVQITGGFLGERLRTHRTRTLPAVLEQCERTGRLANFAVAAAGEGEHRGKRYDDSDVYKVLEGIAYTLIEEGRDEDLRRRGAAIVESILAAQDEDGYLDTYYQIAKPGERWKDIQHGHELYCAGHMIQAAIAWRRATGERDLVEAALRLAEHVASVFGPEGKKDPPGHQEIEIALFALADETDDSRWADLARFFLEQRGQRGGRPIYGDYAQDHVPVWTQRDAVGHAVRCMYQCCAMADDALRRGDARERTTLLTLWTDVVRRKMYVTAGLGSRSSNEGFGPPYELPNAEAYCETCASIGLAMWAHRMFLLDRHPMFADVLERALFNTILAGVSADGERFFYSNPLESTGDYHRAPWFPTACCPTNLARYLPALAERVYAHDDDDVYVVLYAESEAELELADGTLRISQQTEYPWKGRIELLVDPELSMEFALHLRVPGWHEGPVQVEVDGVTTVQTVQHGDDPGLFLVYDRVWKPGTKVLVDFPLEPRRVHANVKVEADAGRVALQRGPVVYALEAVDNGGAVSQLALPPDAKLRAEWRPGLLGGAMVVSAQALALVAEKADLLAKPQPLVAVPYFLWDNRSPGEMCVWIPESAERARLSGEARHETVDGVTLRASYCAPGDALDALVDGRKPRRSSDNAQARVSFAPHLGTTEWVRYDFEDPRELSRASVYFYDDTGRGEHRVPFTWSLSWFDGEAWQPVQLAEGSVYGIELDRFNETRFAPVRARAIRLELQLREGATAGLLEWTVGS